MKKFKIFLIVFFLLALGALWFISTGYYSSGDRAGTISKFGERGYIFKTWEGQLMEGGFSGETGSLSPRYWDFSSKDDTVVEKIRRALSTGERVTLLYREKYVKFPWNGETKFMVYDVEFLKHLEPDLPTTEDPEFSDELQLPGVEIIPAEPEVILEKEESEFL